jgi:CRP-like cAMP-binding protein
VPVPEALIREFPLCSGLDDKQVNALAKLCQAKSVYPDEFLFKEGELGHSIYILENGDVEVTFATGHGSTLCTDQVGSGDIIGCSAMVPPYVHTSTARTLSEVTVLVIDAIKLRELFKQDHQLGFCIQQHLMQALLKRITDLRLA